MRTDDDPQRVPLTGTARIHRTHKQRPYAQASCAAGENPIGAPEV